MLTHENTTPETKADPRRVEYASLLIVSSGGQWFTDTSLNGLLRQTQDFLDGYHRPGTFSDYCQGDHELNVRTVWSIMADEPSSINETGERYYFAETIH
jgi:hypothetical protein